MTLCASTRSNRRCEHIVRSRFSTAFIVTAKDGQIARASPVRRRAMRVAHLARAGARRGRRRHHPERRQLE